MTTPSYFTVVADYKAFIEDAASDSDYDPQVVPISATVTFTPLIPSGDVVLATNASPRPTGFIPAPVVAIIDPADGRLKLRTTQDAGASGGYGFAPVRLLCSTFGTNNDLLELDGPLFYRVAFTEVVLPNGRRGSITGFDFEAPNAADTVLNLITVSRAPGTSPAGITKIAPGAVRTVDTNFLQFSFGGVDIPEAVEITLDASGIGDSTTVGRAVITAANEAAARAAIGAENAAMKGASGGYAPLDSSAKIDAAYLPSYVDDVLSYANQAAFPVTGETGKIYVAQDTGDAFRWTGSAYLRISDRVTAAGITDSTSVGRSLVTSADATAARTVLGGTSIGQALFTAASEIVARSAVGSYSTAVGVAAGKLYDRMDVAPSYERRIAIEGLMYDLMLAGVWDQLDGLYVFAAHDRQAARLNWTGGGNPVPPSVGYSTWKPPSMRDCTEVNAPTFTADRGFTGDGVSSYLDTNTRGEELTQYTPTDCAAGVYVNTAFSGTVYDLGGQLGLRINASNSSNNTVVNANSTTLQTAANGGDNLGLFGFSRSGTTSNVYKDGEQIGTGTVATLSTNPAQSIEFLRWVTTFSPRRIAAGFVGGSLTADQWNSVNAALTIYMAQIGASA